MTIGPELLPCPTCGTVTRAAVVVEGVDVVHCAKCGKLLRRRPALTAEQRAQAQALRWAAGQLRSDPRVLSAQRRRKGWGDAADLFALGKLAAADQLLEWARTIHRRPPPREGT